MRSSLVQPQNAKLNEIEFNLLTLLLLQAPILNESASELFKRMEKWELEEKETL